MRIFLFSLLALAVLTGNAQDLKTDTMTYKGKLCYVYPYKFEWKKGYRKGTFYQENREIPPVLDSLPSGDYVMLHAFKPSWRNKWKNKHGKLKPIIGAEFKVDSGKLNGKAVYYYYDGQKRREGYFYNGLKDGEWLFISTYYSNKLKKAVPYLAEIATYNKGVKEGYQKEMNSAEKPTLEYYKKGDGFYNFYRSFYWNGQMQYEYRSDSTVKLFESVLRPIDLAGSYAYDTAVTTIDFSRMTPKQIKQYYKSQGYNYNRKKSFVKYYYDEDYYGYSEMTIPEEIPFVVYHENGEVMGRFEGYSDADQYALKFDTVYNPLGRPAMIKVPLTDSVERGRYRLDFYNAKRQLDYQVFYVIDTAGEHKVYRRDNREYGKMQTKFASYGYFRSNDWKGKRLDSLYLNAIENDESGIDSFFVCPNIPEKIFKSSLDSASGYRKYHQVIKYDSAMYKYSIVMDMGRVQARAYYHNDTSERRKAILLLQDILRRHFTYSYGDRKSDLRIDSMQLSLDGKPFTGKVVIYRSKRKKDKEIEGMKISDGLILYDVAYEKRRTLLGSYFNTNCVVTFQFVNGRIHTLEDKSNKNYAFYQFKNNMAHGKVVGTHKVSAFKKLTAFEISTEEGVYNGTSKLYNFKSQKEGKGDKKHFVYEIEHFNMGWPCDTHSTYYSNGQLREIWSFDENGKWHGDDIHYTREGKVDEYFAYKNGKLHGVWYQINELGDTTRKAFYVNGKKEGKYFKEHYNEFLKIYDYRLMATYHKGRLEGDLNLRDSYNTVRLELKIDSGEVQPREYLNEKEILNEWSDILAFTGEVNVFHPNGKKYLNGRMVMSIDTLAKDDYSYSMKKTGVWTYYNTVNRKIAELNFRDDAKLIFGADTLSGVADYKAFYANGNTKYAGVLNYEDVKLNCATDIKEADFVATYSTFISFEGDTLVKNGNGHLKLYNDEGQVISEGDLKNGKKTGWWKTYNDEGKLIEVGQYVDDQKDGRWLAGDLTGINYLDPQCFMSEEVKQEKQESEKYQIKIEETIYKLGEELSSQQFEFTRTK